MKLGTQIGAGLVLLLGLTAGLATWQLVLIERLHQANRDIAGADLEVSRNALRMRLEVDRLTDLTQRFFVLRDPGYRGELRRVRGLVETDLGHLKELPVPPREILPLLRGWREYGTVAEEVEARVPGGGEAEGARQQLLAALTAIRGEITGLDGAAVERVSRRIAESTARARQARRTALLVVSAGLLLALILVVWISRSTVRPLRSLAAGARALAAGDFDYRVRARGSSEVESLARDFNLMARRLGEVDAMKSQFVSSVSHDLKAPLASMQETTRLLLEDATLDAEQRRLLELNAQCGDRLERMIADLLEVARLEAGAVELELETLDLVRCCRQVLDEASGLLEAGDLRVDAEWEEEPLTVRADVNFLMQALWNLVSNAIKFSPEGGTIEVRLRRLDGELPAAVRDRARGAAGPAALLTIADQGPGVADEDKPRIFDRFFRSRKHERYASGIGLGLAITRAIVEHHRGHVWVEDAPGGGSLFSVLLPGQPREAAGG